MLITKCNICLKEIQPAELDGGLVRKVEKYALMPGLENHGPMPTKLEGQEIWNLCQECQEVIWKFAEDRKNEKEKTKIRPVL